MAVSATKADDTWSFKGAGIVHVPKEICFKEAMNFDRLKEIPERFSLVEWNAEKSQLKLQVIFLGERRDLVVKVSPDSLKNEISFEVIEGWQQGLSGTLYLSDSGRQHTEAGVVAQVQRSSSWVPNFVFGTAVEAVMHHIALSLRNGLEKSYKN